MLVVEDDPEVLSLVQTTLEAAGMQVTGAQREGEAMARLREGQYEAVVTDLYVTRGQEGLESITGLLQAARGTPVGVITGWPVEAAVAEQAGVAFVVRKPFELEEVVRAVKEAIGREAREG